MRNVDDFSGPTDVSKLNVDLYLRKVIKKEQAKLHKTNYPFSLDAPLMRSCECLLDVIPSGSCPESDLIKASKNQDINNVLATILPSTQHQIICNFFGIGGGQKLPLKMIAELLGVNIDVVKHQKHKAIDVLKKSERAKELFAICL
jgi:DNA-directed RNA polymerase sigma subunit (sigma70/sigma32)